MNLKESKTTKAIRASNAGDCRVQLDRAGPYYFVNLYSRALDENGDSKRIGVVWSSDNASALSKAVAEIAFEVAVNACHGLRQHFVKLSDITEQETVGADGIKQCEFGIDGKSVIDQGMSFEYTDRIRKWLTDKEDICDTYGRYSIKVVRYPVKKWDSPGVV